MKFSHIFLNFCTNLEGLRGPHQAACWTALTLNTLFYSLNMSNLINNNYGSNTVLYTTKTHNFDFNFSQFSQPHPRRTPFHTLTLNFLPLSKFKMVSPLLPWPKNDSWAKERWSPISTASWWKNDWWTKKVITYFDSNLCTGPLKVLGKSAPMTTTSHVQGSN